MSEKYSVLFMRDNNKVRRFRVSPFWLKVMLWTPALITTIAAAGVYISYTVMQENTMLQTERLALQRQLRDTQVHLERLENMEQILNSNDPEELQALFGTMSIEDSSEEQPAIDLEKVLAFEDANVVRVENLTLKKVQGEDKLRMTFDLHNVNTKRSVNGAISLECILRSGQSVAVKVNRNDLVFQISRFKKIATTFKIPKDAPLRDIYGVKVSITNKEQSMLQRVYPMSIAMQ